MSNQDITIIINTFNSDEKIFSCLESISPNISIIIIENSNNIEFKKHYDFLIQNNINENIAKITPKISFGNINYSLKLSKNFKETTNILEELIESLINSNLLKWEKVFIEITAIYVPCF